MGYMIRWKNWREERRHRQAMRDVREGMAALGYSLDGMTDEDILEGCDRLGEALAQTGISLAEVSANIEQALRFQEV